VLDFEMGIYAGIGFLFSVDGKKCDSASNSPLGPVSVPNEAGPRLLRGGASFLWGPLPLRVDLGILGFS